VPPVGIITVGALLLVSDIEIGRTTVLVEVVVGDEEDEVRLSLIVCVEKTVYVGDA
jgi:hypothetical protein